MRSPQRGVGQARRFAAESAADWTGRTGGEILRDEMPECCRGTSWLAGIARRRVRLGERTVANNGGRRSSDSPVTPSDGERGPRWPKAQEATP